MLDDPSAQVLVADIGGSFIRMATVGAESGVIGEIRRLATETGDLGRFLDSIEVLTTALAARLPAETPLILASAGLCDPESGRMTAANIPCIDGQPLARLLSARLGRPVEMINDADAFALAEATHGAGRDQALVFGAIIGTGIGGGIVVNGRILRGHGGLTGEWGHAPIASQVPKALGRALPRMACGCGQEGCADTFGGARGIERLHAALGHGTADSLAIIAGWRKGEDRARQTVAVWAEMLSEPLALVANTLGVSRIVTGGGLGLDAGLMDLLDREVRARVLGRFSGALLHPGTVPDAALTGGAALGRQVMRG